MSKKKSVVVVGPSGSGKSTLVNHLRSPDYEPHLVIPKRVITLPIRADSDPTENRNVCEEVFKDELQAGLIKPWWDRQLGDDEGARHFYGFEKVPKGDPRLRLYLGNNALLGATSRRIHKLMERSLVVVVTADPQVRGDRLDERLPDMDSAEKAKRVGDPLDGLQKFSPLDVVHLDTTGQAQEESRQQFAEIILGHAGVTSPQQLIEQSALA